MNTEIKAIHFTLSARAKTYVEKKLPRLAFASDLIVDFLLHITKGRGGHTFEATVNFRWGSSIHVGLSGYDLIEGIDKLFDKVEMKIRREKTKVQKHRKKEDVRI